MEVVRSANRAQHEPAPFMDSFHWADWLVILVYLAGIILFGLWCSRGQHNTRDYFLGGKDIPWWGVGLSIVATETSALTFIGIPALSFGGNLTFIQISFGYLLGRLLLARWVVPRYFSGEIYSPYQLFQTAFGRGAQRLAASFFLISGTLAAGVRVYVTCIPLKLLLNIDMEYAILIFVVLSLAYTYAGGIKAVIWTDVIQCALLVGGGLFALFYIPTMLEGGMAVILEQPAKAGKLHWLNMTFSLGMPFNLWMGLIGATIFAMSTHGADQLIVQRLLSCRSVEEGRKALILSAIIIVPLFLLFLLVGTLLWVYYQAHDPVTALPFVPGSKQATQDDYIFPIFILEEMPIAMKGLLIVAVLSAAMSSVSSALSALASVSTMDIMKGLMVQSLPEKHYLTLSRISTVFWAAILVIVAYASRQAASILDLAFSLSGLTSGAMLGGLILALRWKGGALPVSVGMLVSFGIMLWIKFGALASQIAWPWFTLIGVISTLGVAYGVRRIIPN